MKAVVYNLGCKVNQYECDSLLFALQEAGYSVSDRLEPADLYILNTCAVTGEAERKSRQCVTRVRKLNAEAKIVVFGCASELNAQQFEEKEGVLFVSGVADKMQVIERLADPKSEILPLPTRYEDNMTPASFRTRAYVKVQDGCDRFCSYCIIPYVRGRSRSRSVVSIVAECERLARDSRELVLTGIDLSSYGKDTGSSLLVLIEALSHIDARIRLGSLEACVIDGPLLQALENLRDFCPHFHLSLQSGSDRVLKEMNRKYTAEDFLKQVQVIRAKFPDAAITTDLIVGFPVETVQMFEETMALIKKIGFADMHIFPYSRREGTVAAKRYREAVADMDARLKRAHTAAGKMKNEYLQRFVNKTLSVLIETEEDGMFSGYSENYIRVYIDGAVMLHEIVRVHAIKPYKDGLLAVPVEEKHE